MVKTAQVQTSNRLGDDTLIANILVTQAPFSECGLDVVYYVRDRHTSYSIQAYMGTSRLPRSTFNDVSHAS